jgi:hypothetical protein
MVEFEVERCAGGLGEYECRVEMVMDSLVKDCDEVEQPG